MQNSVYALTWPWSKPDCNQLKEELEKARRASETKVFARISQGNKVTLLPCSTSLGTLVVYQDLLPTYINACKKLVSRFNDVQQRYSKYCRKSDILDIVFDKAG